MREKGLGTDASPRLLKEIEKELQRGPGRAATLTEETESAKKEKEMLQSKFDSVLWLLFYPLVMNFFFFSVSLLHALDVFVHLVQSSPLQVSVA